MAKYGFKIIEKEYFMDDHSIFYAAMRDTEQQEKPLSKNLYNKNKEVFLNFIDSHKKIISEYNLKINNSTGPIYLFCSCICTIPYKNGT